MKVVVLTLLAGIWAFGQTPLADVEDALPPSLTEEGARRVEELSRKERGERLLLRWPAAIAAASEQHRIRLEQQGGDWHETRDVAERIKELTALSRVAHADERALRDSEFLDASGFEFLARSVGFDATESTADDPSGADGRAEPAKLAARIAAWRSAVFGEDARSTYEGTAWKALSEFLASPQGRSRFPGPLSPDALGGRREVGVREFGEYLLINGAGEISEEGGRRTFDNWKLSLPAKKVWGALAGPDYDGVGEVLSALRKRLARRRADASAGSRSDAKRVGYEAGAERFCEWASHLAESDARRFGDASPQVARSRRLHGRALLLLGREGDAATAFRSALLAGRRVQLDNQHDVVVGMIDLAMALSVTDPNTSDALLAEAEEIFRKTADRSEAVRADLAEAIRKGTFRAGKPPLNTPRAIQGPPRNPVIAEALLRSVGATDREPVAGSGGLVRPASSPAPRDEAPEDSPVAKGDEPESDWKSSGESRAEEDTAKLRKLLPGVFAKAPTAELEQANRTYIAGKTAWATADHPAAEAHLREAARILEAMPTDAQATHQVGALHAAVNRDLVGVLLSQGKYGEAKARSVDADRRARASSAEWDGLSRTRLRSTLLRAATALRRSDDAATAEKLEGEADRLGRRERVRSRSMGKQRSDMFGGRTGELREIARGHAFEKELTSFADQYDALFAESSLEQARRFHERNDLLGALEQLSKHPSEELDQALSALERGMILERLEFNEKAEAEYRSSLTSLQGAKKIAETDATAVKAYAKHAVARMLIRRGAKAEAAALVADSPHSIGGELQLAAQIHGLDLGEQLDLTALAFARAEVADGDLAAAEKRLRDLERAASARLDQNVGERLGRDLKSQRPPGSPRDPLTEAATAPIESYIKGLAAMANPGGRDLLVTDRKGLAAARSELAAILIRRGGEASALEAEKLLVLAIVDQRDLADPELYKTCCRLAELLLRKKDREYDAACLFREAIFALEHERRAYAGDEADDAGEFAERMLGADPYAGLLRTAMMRPADAEGLASAVDEFERGKGRALMELIHAGRRGDVKVRAHAKAARSSDQNLRKLCGDVEADEIKVATRYERLLQEFRAAAEDRGVRGDEKTAKLYEELAAVHATEKSIRVRYAEIAGDGAFAPANAIWTVARVRTALEPGEVLVVYEIGPVDSLVISIEKNSPPQCFRLAWPDGSPVGVRDLANATGKFNAYDGAQRVEATRANRFDPDDLFATLVPKPLDAMISRCRRVFVVPDGPLHALPFEALKVPKTDGDDTTTDLRWLDRRPPVVYGASFSTLLAARESSGTTLKGDGPELVALGRPKYYGVSQAGTEADRGMQEMVAQFSRLNDLPGTEVEAVAIAELFKRVKSSEPGRVLTLLNADATPDRLREAADAPKHLHIGAHGLAVSGALVQESALALSGRDRDTPVQRLRLADLLKSWGGRLAGTRLVTLSACQTATGTLAPRDGIVSLYWGFLYAGAETVVATRWKIDDTATALLMERFYKQLLRDALAEEPGAPPSGRRSTARIDALHAAQKWLRSLTREEARREVTRLFGPDQHMPLIDDAPYSDPKYWAGFMLTGCPD